MFCLALNNCCQFDSLGFRDYNLYSCSDGYYLLTSAARALTYNPYFKLFARRRIVSQLQPVCSPAPCQHVMACTPQTLARSLARSARRHRYGGGLEPSAAPSDSVYFVCGKPFFQTSVSVFVRVCVRARVCVYNM